jgi:hypothetical protein
LRTPALLLDPIFADGACIVLAPPPHHRSDALVNEENSAERDRAQCHPQHEVIFAPIASLAQLDNLRATTMSRFRKTQFCYSS